MPQSEAIVFVVDDDDSMRDALAGLIRSAGLDVETFASAREFLARPPAERPSCLVLDVRMPGLSGLDLQREIAAGELAIPIIFITGHGDVPMAVRAMKAGAIDFIAKPFNDQALLDRVQQAIERDTFNRSRTAERREIHTRWAKLTPREREVMEMVVSGHSNKTIAAHLGVSSKTVEAHRAKFMEKMQASSIPDLMRLTLSYGISRPEQQVAVPPNERPPDSQATSRVRAVVERR